MNCDRRPSKLNDWEAISKRGTVELPSDIIFSILVKLPVKSLMIFQCLCKSWHALISDPIFLAQHNESAKQSLLVMKYGKDELWEIHTLPLGSTSIVPNTMLMNHNYGLYLCSSYNGLLCFSGRRSIDMSAALQSAKLMNKIAKSPIYRHDMKTLYFYLHNPLTKQWLTLPPVSCKSHQFLAFYFHSKSSQYKLVCYFIDLRKTGILTIGSTSWRICEFSIPRAVTQPGIMLHDKIHWVPNLVTLPLHHWFVVVFDTVSETFCNMRFPPLEHNTTERRIDMFELGGRLVISDVLESKSDEIELWVLEDYKQENWVKKHVIDMDIAKPVGLPYRIFCSAGDLFIYYDHCVVIYNIHTKTMSNTTCRPLYQLGRRGFYKESLIQLDIFRGGSLDLPPSPTSAQWYAQQIDAANSN